MKFPIALLLTALTASVAANDYEFDMYLTANPNEGACSTEPEHIADSGEKGCASYFLHGAASAWKLKNLKSGCTVNFYSDTQCKDKLDWIDGKSPKGKCKEIPGFTAARAFEVKCS
ncbi:hypothetical protein F4821DRAFT_233204 [Hypoxylon rubiginosum]|uniref:Uncharacterized protein n=1 Tax=Hypoxylon rubiginosum TaxID=110542 RepID=A0ACC0D740_9PEZI|nr:hypothetical protein F4821DRAFT_233204 [Hypoxylon rubiginosum]